MGRTGLLSTVLLALVVCACGGPREDVVAGSALMAAAVTDVAGGDLTMRTLIPAGMCPGHYDIRPSDVEAVARCRATLIHPWQRQMPNVRAALDGAKVTDDCVTVVEVDGNWMVPVNYEKALVEVARVLARIEPGNGMDYAQRAAERAEGVMDFAESLALRSRDGGAAECRVLCNAQQALLVEWAGFDVVATFGRAEDLSVADVQGLVARAKEAEVVVVIDNLQSGDTRTGEAIAREIGCGHVVLSNFPGAFDDTETWEKALERNVDLLLEATAAQAKRNG
ncbi:MAG: zinc ABC transporter substrate-binding protein [bacterium]|nr:zinc ABC transporter substrate-binding protein [bacterium]